MSSSWSLDDISLDKVALRRRFAWLHTSAREFSPARHIRESCPSLWNSLLISISALIGIGLLGVVLALVFKRTTTAACAHIAAGGKAE